MRSSAQEPVDPYRMPSSKLAGAAESNTRIWRPGFARIGFVLGLLLFVFSGLTCDCFEFSLVTAGCLVPAILWIDGWKRIAAVVFFCLALVKGWVQVKEEQRSVERSERVREEVR